MLRPNVADELPPTRDVNRDCVTDSASFMCWSLLAESFIVSDHVCVQPRHSTKPYANAFIDN